MNRPHTTVEYKHQWTFANTVQTLLLLASVISIVVTLQVVVSSQSITLKDHADRIRLMELDVRGGLSAINQRLAGIERALDRVATPEQ